MFACEALSCWSPKSHPVRIGSPACRPLVSGETRSLMPVNQRLAPRRTVSGIASLGEVMVGQDGFSDRSATRYRDRIDAADQLAIALGNRRGSHPLIEAIPRGAVPMGRIIADRLDGELDVVLTRKLAAPGAPEFAIGAVDETGWVYLSEHARASGADNAYIAAQVEAELETIRRRRRMYTPDRSPVDPRGREVIVVDDGLATGATMIAALHSLRARHPARLTCAVPVASAEAVDNVRDYADDLVVLQTPPWFRAVGQFYARFPQVDDNEVIALLRLRRPDPAAPVRDPGAP